MWLTLLLAPNAEATLQFDAKWGTLGTGDGQFDSPEGVGVAPGGDVYVADTGNDRIQRFDSSGTFVGKWGGLGSQTGRFFRPLGVAVDSGGNVYVADSGNNRVQKFDPSGAFLAQIGSFGTGPGQFSEPVGVAIDPLGNLYVTDSGNRRVQKFDPAGNFTLTWGSAGSTDGRFDSPAGIGLDSVGNVYVADSGNRRVQKFTSSGLFLAKWGSLGSGEGQFDLPSGLAVSGAGVYVGDAGNHRVTQFDTAGSFVFFTGGRGSGDGELQFPAALAVDGSGRVYVADSANHRVQRFRPTAGGVIVTKDAQPDDATDFGFAAGGGLSPASFSLEDDGDIKNSASNTRSFGVDAGSGYSLSEAAMPGWDLLPATCSDGSDPANIAVSAGEVVRCTFTNRMRGQVIVVQDSAPDDPQDFSFTAGGGLSPASFQLDDDGDDGNGLSHTQVLDPVPPGAGYTVSQTTPAGWDPATVVCSDGSNPANIDVSTGETVTCTFSNVASSAGRIVVVKDAQPNSQQDFAFTAGGGLTPASFQLDDDGNETNTLSSSRTFIVFPGSGYSVSESPVTNWFPSATCSDGSDPSNIDVTPDETVTCTFTNKQHGRIIVRKNAVPDDPQDFSFTAGGGLTPSSFQLDNDDALPGSTDELQSSILFDPVQPGDGYSILETVPSGWQQTSATCSDGSPPTSIDVAPAETVVCRFANLNQSAGHIVVVKDAQPDSAQDFNFTTGGELEVSNFRLDDDGGASNSFPNTRDILAAPGSYSVTESAIFGWELLSATCTDGSDASSIDLGPNETVTCTFENRHLDDSYARPKGATPLRVPLVPAFIQCTAPNRTHGPPLGSGSCNPPSASSPHLTIGTPDANGAAANAVGSLRLAVVGTSADPDDADVLITGSTTDVRCKAGVATCGPANTAGGDDYVGGLRGVLTLRITDRGAVSPPHNQTVQDISFDIPMACSATAASQGGTCATDTSADALVPGSVIDLQRAIWAIAQVQVTDGGPDGDTSTADGDAVYLRQGIFVP